MDAVLTDNEATAATFDGRGGGGIFIDGCAVSLQDSTIADNLSHGTGGGIAIIAGSLEMTDSMVSSNTATTSDYGGGLGVHPTNEAIDVQLTDTWFVDNAAGMGGGIYMSSAAYEAGVVCEATKAGGGGFVRNDASDGYGGALRFLYIHTAIDFTSARCDWGTSKDDNTPNDVGFWETSAVLYTEFGDNEHFVCDAKGCY